MTTDQCALDPGNVSVDDAARDFLELIARVERGQTFVVTKNDCPVARIMPVENERLGEESRRAAAVMRLHALMKRGKASSDGWTFTGDRDALHDRS